MGSEMKAQELCNFRSLQQFRWLKIKLHTKLIYSCLKIDRITNRKIKYWKDFFQQNCSWSTFIKEKKGHIKVAESNWGRGGKHMPPLPPPILPSSDCPDVALLIYFYMVKRKRKEYEIPSISLIIKCKRIKITKSSFYRH